jgi:hypothetical protein
MAYAFNPATGTFIDVPDDANAAFGFGLGADPGMPDSYGSPDEVEAAGVPEPAGAEPPGGPPEPVVGNLAPYVGPNATPDNLGVLDGKVPAIPRTPTPMPSAPVGAAPEVASESQSSGSGYSHTRQGAFSYIPPADYSAPMGAIKDARDNYAGAVAAGQDQIDYNTGAAAGVQAAESIYQTVAQGQEDDLQKRYADARMRAEGRIKAAQDAVPKMDPGRAFHNMNGFAKGLLVLASGLNGFNIRYNQGKNQIADILTQIAERDIEAQKVDVETAREKVFRAERGYERTTSAFDKQIADHRYGVIQRLGAFKTKLEQLRDSSGSEVNKMKLAEGLLAIDQRMGEIGIGIIKDEMQQAHQDARSQKEIDAANWRQASGQRFQASEAEKARKAAGAPEEGPSILLPGGRRVVLDKQRAANMASGDFKELDNNVRANHDMAEAGLEYRRVLNDMKRRDRLRGYKGPFSASRLGAEDQQRLEAAFQRFSQKALLALAATTFTEGVKNMVQETVGKPPGLTGGDPSQRLDDYLKMLANNQEGLLTQKAGGKLVDANTGNPINFYKDYLPADKGIAQSVDGNALLKDARTSAKQALAATTSDEALEGMRAIHLLATTPGEATLHPRKLAAVLSQTNQTLTGGATSRQKDEVSQSQVVTQVGGGSATRQIATALGRLDVARNRTLMLAKQEAENGTLPKDVSLDERIAEINQMHDETREALLRGERKPAENGIDLLSDNPTSAITSLGQ